MNSEFELFNMNKIDDNENKLQNINIKNKDHVKRLFKQIDDLYLVFKDKFEDENSYNDLDLSISDKIQNMKCYLNVN